VSAVAAALERLAELPGVADAIGEAREACTQLRWHPALRRRAAETRAEAGVRAVRAAAALAGARLPVDLVRDVGRGAAAFPPDASGRTALGVLRAHAEAEALAPGWERAPLQVLARLHVVAAAGLVPDAALGRPRLPGEVPALVVAALAHAEIATLRPFVAANGVVARAVCRALVVGRGLDPTGVAVWEAALLAAGPPYPLTLAHYGEGSADGARGWLLLFARALTDGAGEGRAVADAVLAGRLS
jgi:hypothetical protein